MADVAAARSPEWRHTPIGKVAVRWLDALRWQDMADATIESYTVMAAKLAAEYPTLTMGDLCAGGGEGEALLRLFMQTWQHRSPATKRARTAALRSFMRWAHDEGIIPRNPAENIKAPGQRSKTRQAHAQATLVQLVAGQDSLRDRCAIQLLARVGLRKNELRLLRVRDIRFDTGDLHVLHGKGGNERTIPLGSLPSLRDDLYFHVLAEERQPAEYLLYPKTDRARPMDPSAIHRWFGRCLQNAGLPSMPMHEMRHTAADNLYRTTRDLTAVQMLLGHDSLGTTQAYLHPTRHDLALALEQAEAAWAEAVAEGVRS